MARRTSHAATLRDIRRDWRGWTAAERFAAKLAGFAGLTIAVLVSWPRAF